MSQTQSRIPDSAEKISRVGFSDFSGPFYRLEAAPDNMHARYGFVAEHKHMNGSGNLHGGLLLAFADIAMGHAARAIAGSDNCSAVSLTGDFIAGGQQGELIEALVRVSRKTRTLVFQSVDIVASQRILMVASGLWKIG